MPDNHKPHLYEAPEESEQFLCSGCYQPEARCQCFQLETEGARIEGVGPQAPVVTNDKGGSQSDSPYRCDLLPFRAVLMVSKVLKNGAGKYGPNNWRKIARVDHLNHALAHLCAHGAGDTQDDHLAHAACRILMALETK